MGGRAPAEPQRAPRRRSSTRRTVASVLWDLRHSCSATIRPRSRQVRHGGLAPGESAGTAELTTTVSRQILDGVASVLAAPRSHCRPEGSRTGQGPLEAPWRRSLEGLGGGLNVSGSERAEATRILSRATSGDARASDALVPLVYQELRRLAQKYMLGERPGHTLQATALVNEAYLRLVDASAVSWQGRTHFLALAAREMRRVLLDHARCHGRLKRGGGRVRVSLDAVAGAVGAEPIDTLDLESSLVELARLDERQAQVVTLRFFGNLTVEEVAEALGVSTTTVEKDWRMARAWLLNRLSADPGSEDPKAAHDT